MITEVTETGCRTQQGAISTLTQHHIKAVVRKERERVKVKTKGTENRKNLATIAAFPATQLETVDEGRERRKKSKTTMKRKQRK
jgi:hypothetical protein